jgi:putative peptidoglycan lipid II flippase
VIGRSPPPRGSNAAPEEPPPPGDALPPPRSAAGPLDPSLLPDDGFLDDGAATAARDFPPTADVPAERPPAPVGRRLAGATLVVGAAFVLSRLLGLVRDQIIAGQFGLENAPYLAAFRVPDTLFLLIIGGAVGSAFIPVFSGLMEEKRAEAAWRLATTLINASVVLLALSGIALGFAAPWLVSAFLVPDWPADAQARTVELTQIMLLSPLFLGLGGWAQGILNARQSFTLPALAPVAYNGAIIAGALFLAPALRLQGLAIGVVAGALLHFLVQVPGLVRAGMRYQPLHLNLHDEGVAQVTRLMLPRIAGQAAFQINILAMTNIASSLPPENLAALNYAQLLMMLPHGVFAMSLSTVLFPTMTAQIGRGDTDGMRRTLSSGLRTLIFLTLPTAVMLGLLRDQIVGLLFQFGRFHAGSTPLVASALGWFAWGLLAYVVVELVTRGFYALHDTRTPVLVAVATVVFNIALSRILLSVYHMDHTGLALSLSFTTTLEMIGLILFLRRRLHGIFDRAFLRATAVSLLGAALMAAALWFLVPWLTEHIWAYPYDPAGVKVATALQLAIAGLVGGGIYLGVARLFHAEELGAALRLLSRRAR